MKFFGACNDEKAAMDTCFRAEKIVARKKNMLKARAFREKYEALKAERRQHREGKESKGSGRN